MQSQATCKHPESERRACLGDLSLEYCGLCGKWLNGPGAAQ